MGKNMEKESFYGVISVFIKGILVIMTYMGLESTLEVMGESIMENGKGIRWKEEECLVGVMEGSMKESM